MRVEQIAPQTDWQATQVAAAHCEELGYDYFAAPEIKHNPFTPLAVATLATKRIQLRTAIAVAFPRSPMTVANVAWDLQENSCGRFSLGLGTQVKGHNERRFSVPWSAPAARLREYVESLRAIWRTWQFEEPLQYEGEHFQFSLMPPTFRHPPSTHGAIPVYTAAVRPAMMRLAGRIADGVRLHGFCSRRYLAEVALPNVEIGLERSGKARQAFEVCGGGMIITAQDQDALRARLEETRYRIAFYGSTRTYAPVFALHGWDELTEKLHAYSKANRWPEMAALITDEILEAFTISGTFEELPEAISRHYGGLSDSIELVFPDGTDPDLVREVITTIHQIPTRFERHDLPWQQEP
jgi:probable F420-dependent oxidoreductase